MAKVYGVILASGSGERFNSSVPKQFVELSGKPLIEYSIEAFEKNKHIDEIILVLHPDYIGEMKYLKDKYKKLSIILPGGKTRRESSSIGVNCIENNDDFVLIHDGARPFVSDKIISETVEALKEHDAVTVAIPSSDTIFKVNDDGMIEDIPDRKYMMRCQTPQGFKTGVIKEGHRLAEKDNIEVTDDCSVILKYNLSEIYMVIGEDRNMKVTYESDLFSGKACWDK